MVDKTLTVGAKVGLLRQHFGLSQADFAALLGISRSTVAAYETRGNANPTQEKARAWAYRFGIPFSWFLDQADAAPPIPRDHKEAERLAKTTATRGTIDNHETLVTPIAPEDMTYEEEDFASMEMIAIPVWNGIVAGLDECHFLDEKSPRTIEVPKFFFSRKDPSRFILALPKGRSMAPRIVSPDRLISLLTADAPPNSMVVARREDGVNFVKTLRIDRMGNKELHSINPEFPPITNLDGFQLRAAVVGIWKPYEMSGPNIEFNGGQPLRA